MENRGSGKSTGASHYKNDKALCIPWHNDDDDDGGGGGGYGDDDDDSLMGKLKSYSIGRIQCTD